MLRVLDWVWINNNQRTCQRCLSIQKLGMRDQCSILAPSGNTCKEEENFHGIRTVDEATYGQKSDSFKVPYQEQHPGRPAIARYHCTQEVSDHFWPINGCTFSLSRSQVQKHTTLIPPPSQISFKTLIIYLGNQPRPKS